MPNSSFFLAFDNYANCKLKEFGQKLNETQGKRVGDVTISDLCMRDHPNGLYFYFDTQAKLQYVGKCTSRSFIERVPSHFDQRETAWLNTVPKNIVATGVKYDQALAEALKYKVILFGIQNSETAKALETALRHTLEPRLNTPKNKKEFNGEQSLKEIVGNNSTPMPNRRAIATPNRREISQIHQSC